MSTQNPESRQTSFPESSTASGADGHVLTMSVDEKPLLRRTRQAAFILTGYLLLQTAANLTVQKTLTLPGQLLIPFGSLLFAVTYTWNDVTTRVLGKSTARTYVLCGVAFQVLLTVWLAAYVRVPGSAVWEDSSQDAIAFVFSAVPRIVLASLVTNLLVQNLDISLFHHFYGKRPAAPRWQASALSNTISAPTDGVVFATLAFAGTLPTATVISIALASAAYKLLVSYASLPLNYIFAKRRGD